MRFKRFIYSILLILFTLALLLDLGLWFLIPDAGSAADGNRPSAPGSFPEGMSLPEGMSFPEGMTFSEGSTSFPEGLTFSEGSTSFPEGMTFPEGATLPEGMTRPGSSAQSEGSESAERPRRSDRTRTDTEAAAETAAESGEPSLSSALSDWLSELLAKVQALIPAEVVTLLSPVKQAVAPYRLYILIGSGAAMVLCILRLIFLNRRIRRQREEQENDPAHQKRVALWPAFGLLLLALGLVMFLFPGAEEDEAEDGAVANTRIVSGTVEEKVITSLIQSAGSLEEQEAVTLTIPASVTVSSVCVKNGDTVTAGQIVALADRTALMQSIADLHEALEDIDSQLQKAHESKRSTALTAPVAGTVKVVYAQAGQKVTDVMNEHGSLMLLSLDGRMAVQVPASDGLTMGSALVVTLSDGTELAGEVVFLEEGVATVTVTDRGYAIGEQVSVKTAEGQLLGSGPLYVHKPLNIVGYVGTVVRIYRNEGSTVSAGTAVIGLSGTADLGKYEDLLQQRSAYETELQTLFELYETGYIHAPGDGIIEGLSDDLPYAPLSQLTAGLTVRHLASGPADAEPSEYVHYIGQVVENDNGFLYLKVSSNPVTVTSYSSLPSVPSSTMSGTYTIPGSVPIYLLSGGWSSMPASQIQAGDKILFTFDSTGKLVWVIVAHTAASATPTPTPTPTPAPSPTPAETPTGSAGPGESPSPSGSPGGGHGGGGSRIRFSFSGGSGNSMQQQPAYTIGTKELCTITPRERMLLVVPVDELDILSLSLGQEAQLYLDALPAQGFTATVTRIDAEGENNGGNTKYSVTLALTREDRLYPGMNATVCFPRKGGQAVPTVPLAALNEEGNRIVIYTAYDEATDQLLSPVEVQTGISDGTDVEILSGLSAGDAYCYRYADAISYVTE